MTLKQIGFQNLQFQFRLKLISFKFVHPTFVFPILLIPSFNILTFYFMFRLIW